MSADVSRQEQFLRIKRLFLEVRALGDREEREAWLEAELADDPHIRREVEALLRAEDELTLVSDRGDASLRLDAQRLASGDVFDERFRVANLINAGGMGEVYRVHDLVLEQDVALKIVRVGSQSARSLIDEVRISRSIHHPNVARVFDVGWVGDDTYFTMELVEGDDLGSLLKRAGNLSQERVLSLARELCAGLAAAHSKGVLHRDLKPANVLIDPQGRVRICDFGIAVRTGDSRASQQGTPPFMAPELFAGAAASEQSDVYSLGLILYQLVTGEQAFVADSMDSYAAAHRQETPQHLASLHERVDPRLASAIRAALEKDPRRRPRSVLELASLIPGTDVLSMAREIQVTPPPRLIVAAEREGVTLRRAAAIAALTLVVLAGIFAVADRALRLGQTGLDKPPAVMAERARAVLERSGFPESPQSTVFGYLDYLRIREPLGSVLFWYRESPQTLLPEDTFNFLYGARRADLSDPAPMWEPDSAVVMLDEQGRLNYLEYVTSAETLELAESDPGVDPVETLHDLVGVDPEQIELGPSEEVVPPFFADRTVKFRGPRLEEDSTGKPTFLAVEAALLGGRLVYVDVAVEVEDAEEVADRILEFSSWNWLAVLFLGLLPLAAAPLAWRHTARGRADLRGGFRLALAFAAIRFVYWLLVGTHTTDLRDEAVLLLSSLATILLEATTFLIAYLAVEPYVRRVWPHTMIGWTLLANGRFAHREVGRSLLYGACAGTLLTLADFFDRLVPSAFGLEPIHTPVDSSLLTIAMSARFVVGSALDLVPLSSYEGLVYLLVLVGLRRLSGRASVAAIGLGLLIGALHFVQGAHPATSWLVLGVGFGLCMTWILAKFGLLALTVTLFVHSFLTSSALTSDLRMWYAGSGLFAVLVVVTATVAGVVLSQVQRREPPQAPLPLPTV